MKAFESVEPNEAPEKLSSKKILIILIVIIVAGITLTSLPVLKKVFHNNRMDGASVATPTPSKGAWVTVAPNGRYLMFEDGTPFVPLGISIDGDHINMDYYGTTTIGGKRVSYEDNRFEAIFADMKANGENLLRIDIESLSFHPRPDVERLIREGKIQFLENPVGVFNEEYARRIDRLIALAEKHDIYLSLVLIAHTCGLDGITEYLDLYPYHVSRGGPLNTMDDLFTSQTAKNLWKRRMQYISDRWGNSSLSCARKTFPEETI